MDSSNMSEEDMDSVLHGNLSGFEKGTKVFVSDSECSDEDRILEVSENDSDAENDMGVTKSVNPNEIIMKREPGAEVCSPDSNTTSTRITKGINTLRLPEVNVTSPLCISILDSWNLIIPEEIIDKIVLNTNEEIAEKATKYKERTRYIAMTSRAEIRAFIGLLYMSGVMKESHISVEELWSDMYGPPIFHATMTLSRFRFLTACIRFDEKSSRTSRKMTDQFAAIREIWEIYVNSCRTYYNPSEYCTLGTSLLGFRGRCPFRVYKQNHPDKCGINILMLCDTNTNYMVNAMPYLASVGKSADEDKRVSYVKALTKPIHGTNRNVTMDKWFTSTLLADTLLTECKLTIVGPLKRRNLEFPIPFVSPKSREAGTSCYAFDNEKTMVSYIPKNNKTVILLSTMHKDDASDEETGKPKILTFYNQTKDGAEHFVQLCQNYTTARKTGRWPLRVFYGMLDQSAINAMIIFSMANHEWKIDRSNTRRIFLKELALSLVKPYMTERQKIPTLRKDLKLIINSMIGEDDTPVPQIIPGGSKRRCGLCPRKKDKKTALQCQSCAKPVCLDHRAMICISCVHINHMN
ncbi:piggyBac transposable element-derived protein 4 [Cephus cinctus]|uniref:PiggyBac transposable element-derived protein 4 n=1 Tax=Cephus cinctus TaxID=211228 RepID=A0AAJ7VWB1_CEPCN|nr:piggyBac transposable element-derived protein 4 [Cephus cinctus]